LKLQIATDLTLPLEVVTEKLAFLGRTGSGKTYAAMKLKELMREAGAQTIALDPVGAWYGIRIGGSWNVYIFGGLHGDFPLEPTGGKLMADLIVDRGLSVVLDVSQFIRSEQVRFASDFIERFFNRKKASPSAVHLFLEECQEFAPQNNAPNEAHMLHHFERLWKLGRGFGIGGTLLSQRPQEVNKKVLNQSGTLFAFNMTGPQERKAIADWTRQAGIDEDIESVLPKLKVGEPHVWSPTFLNISKTIHILPKTTADVSMTPKVGARTREQVLTPIDVERLTADMAATIEKSKADDPKELRKQILALAAELKKANTFQSNSAPALPPKIVEVSVLTDADREFLSKFWTDVSQLQDKASTLMMAVRDVETVLSKALRPGSQQPSARIGHLKMPQPPIVKHSGPFDKMRKSPVAASSELGNSGLRRILIALAQYPQGRSARQVGILAGLSSKSGSFNTYLSKGRSSGWIEGERGMLRITDGGLEALGNFDPLPQGPELLNYWLSELGDGGAARILRVLAQAYPKSMSKEELGTAAELSHTSGSFNTYLSRLRTLELAEGRGELRASETLFE